jgi:hypothetical protein
MSRAYSMHGRENGFGEMKPESKRSQVRPGHRCKDNIKMNIRDLGLKYGLVSSGLEQGPL